MSRLQALLQARRLHFPVSDEAMIRIKELQEYEINVSQRGTLRSMAAQESMMTW